MKQIILSVYSINEDETVNCLILAYKFTKVWFTVKIKIYMVYQYRKIQFPKTHLKSGNNVAHSPLFEHSHRASPSWPVGQGCVEGPGSVGGQTYPSKSVKLTRGQCTTSSGRVTENYKQQLQLFSKTNKHRMFQINRSKL